MNFQDKASLMISKYFNRSVQSPVFPNILAGLISGLVCVTYSLSFAALIFSGSLSTHLSAGIYSALISATIVGIAVALKSSFTCAIAGPDSNTSAILALMASAIASQLSNAPSLLPTVWTMLVISSIVSGIFLIGLNYLQLGQFVRFIPYPVIGGFLAGAGWLIIRGGFVVTTGIALEFENFSALFHLSHLLHWLSAAGFALLLKLVLSRYNHYLVVPAFLLAGFVLTYLVLGSMGISLEQARAEDWLFSASSINQQESFTGLPSVLQIDWRVLWKEIPSLLAMMCVLALSTLLNATGLELISQQDIDINRELKTCGVANLAAGIGGGMVGFLSFNRSVLNRSAGATGRLSGIVASLFCAAFLFLGTEVIAFVPKPLLGGLLFYIGLNSLIEWLYNARKRLPTIEYTLIILILVIIAGSGFLQGVGAGLVIACLIFAVNYSRTPLIHSEMFGNNRPSNFERSFQQQRILRQQGQQIYILCLRGYIFFGTSNTFLNHVRDVLARAKTPIRYLVFDFHLINGLDSSAVSSFVKLRRFAQQQDLHLVFTHLPPELERQFIQNDCLKVEDDPICRRFPDLDRGIEWCEEQILKAIQLRRRRFLPLTLQIPELLMLSKEETRQFMSYLEPLQIPENHILFTPGAAADTLYFLENGQMSLLSQSTSGEPKRVRTLSSGTVLGEVEFYQDSVRLVSAIADKGSSLYCLSKQNLQAMQKNHPQLAAAFHQFIAHLLAERLFSSTHSNVEQQ
ncbi:MULTISPECIES: SulP family inorganic anion transporter [Leptolyngbya]|nr:MULTISPECIES: SulP family inorganic anion transporter [Leptolyngbya]MBD2367425.1 SLC26A/SulP transporter family protein [Leptolyngbya sp. FACHB-161]MBD2373949.1 SLC26A/SulP transporter family protein [Leptolyngbya sp. FACHB-238]MBD2398251.1 SLC26A/SulP transporter family protein [Leptolyngbya sp. FACHB-239]MBD2404252.1 SLC26A/SulP transporter family protein [Leptolyngbya sp. FACHB-402]MBN8560271.1 SLC26A/SulP transporter family protein [Leptolyngbya sp. UWPOB_LEPTO1]